MPQDLALRPALVATLFGMLALAACTAIRSDLPRVDEAPGFDPSPYDDASRRDVDLQIGAREVIDAGGAAVLRIRYSFVAYRGYPDPSDVRRSTATLFLPLGKDGTPRALRGGEVFVAEYPPGSSASGFDVLGELGAAPAARLGLPSAVVDVRGPVVRDLGGFENPEAPDGSGFRGEEQFAYAMLRSYAQSGDFTFLWEQQVGAAWIRAIRATDRVVAGELGTRGNRFVLAAEGRGALGAMQAAAVDGGVAAVIEAGWPLDWMDEHYVRWRRWERQAGTRPLDALRPCGWDDSRDVLSFLASSWSNPDPGCPSCLGSGARWRAQFDLIALKRGPLADMPILLVLGDSDPDLPVDLAARLAAPLDRLAALPPPAGAPVSVTRGPFADARRMPFDDLRYLHGAASTLAHPDAAESVLAWLQHLGGYRDLPDLRLEEEVLDGNLQVTVIAAGGNTTVTEVEVREMDIGPLDGSDFMHALHRSRPEAPAWREVEPFYDGHDRAADALFTTRWSARFPFQPDRNQAYYAVVHTRVGALEAAHSLPIRVLWNLGDPALGPARL